MKISVTIGDARKVLKDLPDNSIQCCVTSPPYYNLRSYCDEDSPEKEDEIGTEQTPQEYIDNMVDVCREIKRVLRDDGILWINIGDAFYNYRPGKGQALSKQTFAKTDQDLPQLCPRRGNKLDGLKEKDLIGVPWALAFALRDDGWFLRRDIIWNKLNNMPESVSDRATTAHEYIFMFTKNSKYFYDSEAVKEPADYDGRKDTVMKGSEKYKEAAVPGKKEQSMAVDGTERWQRNEDGEYLRNLRSVWSVPTESYTDAHFACVDAETECLTAGGWRRYHELRIGEMIYSYNMENDCLELQQLEDVMVYYHTGNMISVSGRSSSMLLTENHRCVVRRRNTRKGGFRDTIIVAASELNGSMVFPVAAELHGEHIVPDEIPNYYYLLGIVASEGFYSDAGEIGIAQSLRANPKIVSKIDDVLISLNAEYSRWVSHSDKNGDVVTWRLHDKYRSKIRFDLPDKFRLPEKLLHLPKAYIDAFLEGFVDGDGSVREDGRISIYQKVKQPLDIIQAMYVLSGKSCILTQRGNQNWSAYVTDKRFRYFKNATSEIITVVPHQGNVWCPKTKNGTWVARRQGRPFITGNSFSTKLIDPCLKAGTSERGCCPECGAPWERVVEKRRMQRCELPQDDIRYRPNTYHGAYEDINGRGDAGYTVSKTLGWQPTCDCYNVTRVQKPKKDDSDEIKIERERQLNNFKELSSIPCTALDPFAGTGTVGRWCVENDRSVVLIELNPKYKPLIERRLSCNKEVMLIKSDNGNNMNFETSTLDDWL
jgi:DNA modification methylase